MTEYIQALWEIAFTAITALVVFLCVGGIIFGGLALWNILRDDFN